MTLPMPDPDLPAPEIQSIDLSFSVDAFTPSRFEKQLQVNVREAKLLSAAPWVRSLGKLTLEVSTEGWKFPPPVLEPLPANRKPRLFEPPANTPEPRELATQQPTRLKPSGDTVVFKERLLYLLQP